MTGPDDTVPPDTQPEPYDLEVVRRGDATLAIEVAVEGARAALARLEAVAMACARAADLKSGPGPLPPRREKTDP